MCVAFANTKSGSLEANSPFHPSSPSSPTNGWREKEDYRRDPTSYMTFLCDMSSGCVPERDKKMRRFAVGAGKGFRRRITEGRNIPFYGFPNSNVGGVFFSHLLTKAYTERVYFCR